MTAGSALIVTNARITTMDEAAPETPVFVLHLYDRAWLNAAALTLAGGGRWSIDGLHA